MTDKDHNKSFVRQINEGALPWEIEKNDRQGTENRIFDPAQQAAASYHNDGARLQPLPQDFFPEKQYIEFLMVHHGIPEEFILKQVPEFKLYWLETGEARKAWQSKFKNHVIYQWKRKQSEAGQRTQRSTIEKLTDRSWAEGLQLDDEE